VDQLIRFEYLEEDCKRVAPYIGKEFCGLGHRNATSHSIYWQYYDEVTREIVATEYGCDIRMFGYDF
jgi:hypothetical protein